MLSTEACDNVFYSHHSPVPWSQSFLCLVLLLDYYHFNLSLTLDRKDVADFCRKMSCLSQNCIDFTFFFALCSLWTKHWKYLNQCHFFLPSLINLLITSSRNIYIFIGNLSWAFYFYFGRVICRHTANSTSFICVSNCTVFLYEACLWSFLETTLLWCHFIYGPIYNTLYRFVLKK